MTTEKLSARQSAVLSRLSPGLRAALQRLVDKLRRYGHEMELAWVLDVLAWQSSEDGVPRCAGLGVPLTPAGLGAPELIKIDRDQGMDPENVAVVSRAYFRLRAINRVYGQDGHETLIEWLQHADLDPDRNQRDPMGKLEEEE